MHNNSHTKPNSKIRIIHIFAPQIIKTDVANFRDLVQRLTGKPSDNDKIAKKPRVLVEPHPRNRDDVSRNNNNNNTLCSDNKREQGFRDKIKGEEEIWRDANTGAGFLEFDDDDHHGFLKEISNVDRFSVSTQAFELDDINGE